MLIPNLLESTNGGRLHAFALVLTLAVRQISLLPEISDEHILLGLAVRLTGIDGRHDLVSHREDGFRCLAFYWTMLRLRLTLRVMLLTVYRTETLRLVHTLCSSIFQFCCAILEEP